jgi:hypothetical protein
MTVVSVLTDPAVAVKVTRRDPAGTVTDAGTVSADGLLLVRVTTVSTGCGAVRMSVPVTLPTLFTEGAENCTAQRRGGRTVRFTEF